MNSRASAARHGALALGAVSAIGAAIFLWPFAGRTAPPFSAALAVALAAAGGLLVVEAGVRRLDARRLALLVTLVAIDCALRMALVNGFGGFSPIFLLVLCSGFVIGPSFGFLVGALTMVTSALVTGGVGPWLPYQLFAAGWVGLLAGATGLAVERVPRRGALVALAFAGAALGFFYGAAMDVWDWTFMRGQPDFGWTPGIAAGVALSRFARFYLATSLLYDSFRAAGNAAMVLVLGGPVVAALRRLNGRFTVTWLAPATPGVAQPAAGSPGNTSD